MSRSAISSGIKVAKAISKGIEIAQRRAERDAIKQRRELERKAKENAKLSAIENARLEVATFENTIDVLLSIHKEASERFDWMALLSTLPPCPPSTQLTASLEYESELAQWRSMHLIARRVLAGEPGAYQEAVDALSNLSELSILGSSLRLSVPDSSMVQCTLQVNGSDAIPNHLKSLTVAGKVSTKPMPRIRFQELYQDYVCGCVLRVGRELIALLPIRAVLVTATVLVVNADSGTNVETPVLSVFLPRATLEALNFAELDPSDSMANFVRRGDVSIAKKGGDFIAINPLTAADVASNTKTHAPLADLIQRIREMRTSFASKLNSKTTGELEVNP